MAVIGVKSITGITSITNAAGAADVLTFHSNNTTERVRINSSGNVQVNGGAVHVDANGEFAIFEQDTSLAMTNSSKISMDYNGNVARIRSSHNGSGSNAVSRNLGFYIGTGQKLLITSTEITAAVQLNLESAGSYVKSNQLKFNPNGTAYIDHGVVGKDITFRLSNSSSMDFNAISIDSSAQQTKFGKQIVVGLQGGNDVTTIGGGSGIGAYIQLDHASSGINTKLMGNNDSYLNQFHGNLAIGEDDPDGNKLLIRAASTVGTNKGHIMLTGDSATNGQGPQIVFSESGSGSSYAGAYVGHIREGSNSTGALVLGTRGTGGDASTVPTERIRIYSTGQILYSAQGGDNTITSKRTNSAGSNGNYFFHLRAQASGGTEVGGLGFHRDTNTDDSRFVVHTRNTGGSNQERMRIDSVGRVGFNQTPDTAGGLVQIRYNEVYTDGTTNLLTSASKAAFRIRTSSDSSKSLYFGGIDQSATPYLQVGNRGSGGATATYPLVLQPYSHGEVTIGGAGTIPSGNGTSMSEFGSNTGGLTIDDVGVSNTGLRLSHGSDDTYLVQSSNGNFYMSAYTDNDMIFGVGTGGNQRLKIFGSHGGATFTGSTTGTLSYTFQNGTSGASADTKLVIKAYANSGADPYIKFDAGGSDMVVGTYYQGTTNNRLVMGYGSSPSGGVTGIHIYANGEFYQNSASNQTTASAANAYWDGSSGRFLRSTSSIKFKSNVQTLLDSDADKILQCRPVTYQPKDIGDNTQGSDSSKIFYGLIAEEVEVIDPRLVGHDSEGIIQNVEYDRFVPHLINLVKRQSAEIETLKTKVAALESS